MKKLTTIIATIAVVTFIQLFISTASIEAQSQNPSEEEETNTYSEEFLEGTIIEIIEEESRSFDTHEQLYQKLSVRINKGENSGEVITIENGEVPLAQVTRYSVGDQVVISASSGAGVETTYHITDYVRRRGILFLFLIFVLLSIIVGRAWGITSLLGMVYSFFIIFKFILPQLLNGHDPVTIAIIGSMFIIPVTFVLSHGINKKTGIAIIATTVALIITGLLAKMFILATYLTGYGSDDAQFLQIYLTEGLNMEGLLLAGIIIGTLGILDDVVVSQASIVHQLKAANPALHFGDLYSRAMHVGRDHITSMINTLVLAYTGAALPLLLLFVNTSQSYTTILNLEMVAEEVVRTLVGTIGIVLAVPLTTALAAYFMRHDTLSQSGATGHTH